MQALPIDSILRDVVARLEAHSSLVLQASPGSGKTTRVPPACLTAKFNGAGKILVLEPRRLAAKYAARRVAEERGEKVGETVGYQFRFENVSGPRTRILFLTEGMLMRRLLSNPRLDGVGTVILDEFHERHLHSDTALAYLKKLQESRPELRLVVMSATLDTTKVASYLGDCPVVQTEARQFPIEIEYLPERSPVMGVKPLELMVRDAAASLVKDGEGDCLVFLPGMAEIRRAESALEPLAKAHGWRVFPLHGDLSREAQDEAIRKGDRPKVILSTNVAETSLTIEGVTAVVDSGLQRVASYSWWSGIPALKTRAISRASATQRAGRAGRTAPGRCLRLYTRGDFEARPPFETPEIARADLTQTVLELLAMGVEDPAKLPWFEAPDPQSTAKALELLYRLGALPSKEAGHGLTMIGRRLSEIPAHPRIARMLVEAERRQALPVAATLAALLGEGRLDSLDSLDALAVAAGAQAAQDPAIRKTRQLLLSSFGKPTEGGSRAVARRAELQDDVARSVLAGFPDRIARKRETATARVKAGETELIFSSGGSARIEATGIVNEGDTFIALELQERKHLGQARSQLWARSLVLIQPEWLFDVEPQGVEEKEELVWDPQRKKVVLASRMTYGQLTLAESYGEAPPSEESARCLLKEGLGIPPEALETMPLQGWMEILRKLSDKEAIEQALARLKLFAQYFPEAGLPPLEGQALFHSLAPLFADKHELRSLSAIDWPDALLSTLAGPHRRRLEELTPSSLTLPGGRRAKIQYSLERPPWLESRLQDFFGMRAGPAILGGRLPLTLHLLAPNGRAVQVTSDLAGFWERAYPAIRKELSRRYPRHAWPEDPLKAPPPLARKR